MKIIFLFVGKTKERFLASGIEYYLEKLGHYVKTETRIIKPEPVRETSGADLIISRESERILKAIKNEGFLVVLDRGGKETDSEGLASFVSRLRNEGHKNVFFAVGGPLGVSEEIKRRADHVLSLSKMTFTHEMTRLILLEQLYRAFTILRGEKYHK